MIKGWLGYKWYKIQSVRWMTQQAEEPVARDSPFKQIPNVLWDPN